MTIKKNANVKIGSCLEKARSFWTQVQAFSLGSPPRFFCASSLLLIFFKAVRFFRKNILAKHNTGSTKTFTSKNKEKKSVQTIRKTVEAGHTACGRLWDVEKEGKHGSDKRS